MTHDQYIEAFIDLTNKVLPEIALRNSRGDYESGADLLTQLKAKLDDLWAKHVATASAGVAP